MIDRTDSTTPEPPGAGAAGRIRTWVHGPEGSADAERERARAADLARRPPDRRRVVKGEAGDALEPGFEGDPELHARQVRAHAAVDAEAERGVPVDLAVDDDLTGPVELGRVAVGRRERQQ